MTEEAMERRMRNSRTGISINEALGGPANPEWIEWLMGFPTGWTDVDPSAMPSSPPSESTSDGS